MGSSTLFLVEHLLLQDSVHPDLQNEDGLSALHQV